MARDLIIKALTEAVANAKRAGDLPPGVTAAVELQTPRDPRHGDVSTSLALVLASEVGGPARQIAEKLLRHLELPRDAVDKVEVAGAGFINFTFSAQWLRAVLRLIAEQRDEYGSTDVGGGKSLLLEFVSANPTGPVAVVQAVLPPLAILWPSSSRAPAGTFPASITSTTPSTPPRYSVSLRPWRRAISSSSARKSPYPRTAIRATTSLTWRKSSSARKVTAISRWLRRSGWRPSTSTR